MKQTSPKLIRSYFLIVFTLHLISAQAQDSKSILSGRITDAAKKPVELATVVLFTAADSVLVKSAFSETDGRFVFEKIAEGKYVLSVTAAGFQTFKSNVITAESGKPVTVPEITLQPAWNNLLEVAVVHKKAFVERKVDRTVVNVDALIANTGTTALDVLEKSPGVNVDQNGVISLKGKSGVTIFIDDKPTYLSGSDLENYLRSLPASSIDQIEIMTNPPARYDAAGSGGVINIKTKKTKQRGFNGGLTLGYTQGKYSKTNNSFNFNYRNKKFNYTGLLSYGYQAGFTDLDIKRRYKHEDESTRSSFDQNTYIFRAANAVNSKLGMDYYQSEKTTWGVALTGTGRWGNERNSNISKLSDAAGNPDSTIVASNKEKKQFKNLGTNLNYRHQFNKSGHELTADADYLRYTDESDQAFINRSYLPNGTVKSQEFLNGKLPAQIDIYSLKTDYTRPLNQTWKFAAGLKSSYTQTDNIADYAYNINGTPSPDYEKSNHFIYKENIHAGYLNLNREAAKLSLQLGLRLENTLSRGHQLGNKMKKDSAFTKSYTSLFPTMYITYKLDSLSVHQVGLNVGRRIERPYYEDLNPFISPLDKFTYYVGNPFLKPAYTTNLELFHVFKNKITTTLSYSNTTDNFDETIEIVEGTYYSRPGNIGRRIVKSLSVNAGFDLAKWLSVQVYTELANIHSKSDFYTGKLDNKGTYVFLSPTFQFKFKHEWSAELSGRYISKVYNAQFVVGANSLINAGVQKKLSTRSTLKLSFADVFYTRIINGTINNLKLTEAGWRNRGDSRTGTITYSYRFGKAIANLRRHEGGGAESESNRVRN